MPKCRGLISRPSVVAAVRAKEPSTATDIRRMLKRYLARDLYRALNAAA